MSEERFKGTVKFFNPRKYFGFIEREGENDLFFHGSNILEKKELTEGDTVSFEVEEGKKGPMAVKITKIKNTSQLKLPLEEEEEVEEKEEEKED